HPPPALAASPTRRSSDLPSREAIARHPLRHHRGDHRGDRGQRPLRQEGRGLLEAPGEARGGDPRGPGPFPDLLLRAGPAELTREDRKGTRLNSIHQTISY